MPSPSNSSRPKTRIVWVALILIILVAAGSFGYAYWNQNNIVKAQAAESINYTTKPVRTGTITLATSGSVSLVPEQEKTLSFTGSGTVAQLNVAVGDQVEKGQVLAQLDSLDELQADVKTAEQDLLSARQDLSAFKAKAAANLANAQLKVIDAQKAVEDAQDSVVQKDWQRCDQDTKDAYYDRYVKAVHALEALGDGGGSADYYLDTILPQKKIVDQALAGYQSCAGYTDYQVASTQANLAVALAQLKLAQDDLDTFTKNNGLDPSGLAAAENKVSTAEQALETAKDNLEGATLVAPFDGTILSIEGKAGDTIEVTSRMTTVPFITISDLDHPLLKFRVDETDLSMVAKGEAAEVIFDAYPNRTFKGTVTRVDPALSSSDSSSSSMDPMMAGASSSGGSVSGLIQLDLSQETDVADFPKGLTGSVHIIQSSVENVLLVPVEALHQHSDGAYVVYVVGVDGQPEMKPVEIGLSNVASVEIKSGLSAGDTVITRLVQ